MGSTGVSPARSDGRAGVSPARHEGTVGVSPAWREFVHGEQAGGQGWQFVTDGREKYFWSSRSGREWFFDLVADPQEEVNLADDPAAAGRVEKWRRRLIEILAARPEDGLSDGERLIPGKVLKPTRPELLEPRPDPDGKTRPAR